MTIYYLHILKLIFEPNKILTFFIFTEVVQLTTITELKTDPANLESFRTFPNVTKMLPKLDNLSLHCAVAISKPFLLLLFRIFKKSFYVSNGVITNIVICNKCRGVPKNYSMD